MRLKISVAITLFLVVTIFSLFLWMYFSYRRALTLVRDPVSFIEEFQVGSKSDVHLVEISYLVGGDTKSPLFPFQSLITKQVIKVVVFFRFMGKNMGEKRESVDRVQIPGYGSSLASVLGGNLWMWKAYQFYGTSRTF